MKPSFLITCFALLISFSILADGIHLLIEVDEATGELMIKENYRLRFK